MKSLFGGEIPDIPEKQRRDLAHAAAPGTGPEGETCGSCRNNYCCWYHTRYYHKCLLMREHWSHGHGTDIRMKDKACRLWEKYHS